MITYVVFRSVLRSEGTPCIAHVSDDGERTLCGRSVASAAAVDTDAHIHEPDCLKCRTVWDRQALAALYWLAVIGRAVRYAVG